MDSGLPGRSPEAAAPRVALLNLGCRVNRVELDVIGRKLADAGCALVSQRTADIVVINTCAVTGEAQAKTRKAIRHAAHLPQQPVVVAKGCVASLFADELRAIAPSVVVVANKAEVSKVVLAQLRQGQDGQHASSSQPAPTDDVSERTRHGVKIQDGCNLRCSYCIVWKARGPSRSLDASSVVDEVRAAVARGSREVVLTGINLGCWQEGREGGRIRRLPELLEQLLAETEVGRIRLSSIEPPDVTAELLGCMAAHPDRIAPFLHICLQSGCERTLREMRRIYTAADYADIVEQARAALPDLALGTDLIVGFPGETDEDFQESLDFCERMAFSRMHVFRYSRRPGTPAAQRDDQVPPALIAARSDEMLRLADRLRLEQARARVGHDDKVIVQAPGAGVTGGLFDARVDESLPVGELVDVQVRSCDEKGVLDCRSQGECTIMDRH